MGVGWGWGEGLVQERVEWCFGDEVDIPMIPMHTIFMEVIQRIEKRNLMPLTVIETKINSMHEIGYVIANHVCRLPSFSCDSRDS